MNPVLSELCVGPDLASGPNSYSPLGNGPPTSGDPTQSGNAGFVGSARLRLNLASAFALSAFDEEQSRLASTLPAEVQRSRVYEERRIA